MANRTVSETRDNLVIDHELGHLSFSLSIVFLFALAKSSRVDDSIVC